MSVFVGSVTPPEGVIVDVANIYKRHGEDDGWVLVDSVNPAQPFEVEFIEHQAVEVAAAFVIAGVEQSEEEWVTVHIQTNSEKDLPDFSSAISGLSVAQEGGDVVLKWSRDSDLVDHYELGFGASEETRIILPPVSGKHAEARTAWWGTGATTYYVVAISEAGQRSATLAASITIVTEHDMPSQGAVDEHAAGYTGTKSDTEVSGGELQIEENPALTTTITTATTLTTFPTWGVHKGSGTYTTAAVDVGSVVSEKVEVETAATAVKTVPTTKDVPVQIYPTWTDGLAVTPGTRGVLQHVSTELTLLTGLGVAVEIDTAQDGVPTWDGFRAWVPGKRYTFRQVRLRLTLSCPWLYANVRLTALTWRRRRRNRKDEILVTVSATGGTAVSFSEPFTGAPVVQATVEDASNARHATVGSVTANGCDVFLWDSGGVERDTGTVHVTAAGV